MLVLVLMLRCALSPSGHLAIRPMLAHCFSQQLKGQTPNPGKMTALLNLEVDLMFAVLRLAYGNIYNNTSPIGSFAT